MIDFILVCFVAGVFYAGFKAGNKFTTFKALFGAAHTRVADWLK